MSSLTQRSDALQQMPQDFSNFLDSVITISGADTGGRINNIDDFNLVIRTFIEKLESELTSDDGEIKLPDGITKSKLKSFLTKKAQSSDGTGIHMLGGIMMANICRDKLMYIADKGQDMVLSDLALARLKDIFTKGFVEDFSRSLPFRATTSDILRRGNQGQNADDDDDNDNSDGSYTRFFNELFKVTRGRFKWRANIFAPVSNDLQCLRAHSDGNAASIVHQMHDQGTLTCYICGCKIKSLGGTRGQWKMQCEHILPIITAIAHWWLVKPVDRLPRSLTNIYTEEQIRLLKEEYDWSHACCNLIKNNWELINIGPDGCTANSRGISYLLQAIWEGSNPPSQFDCAEVNKTTKNCLFNLSTVKWPGNFKASQRCKSQKTAIIDRIKTLTSTINNNILSTNNYQVYTLFTKFRVMSAITDDSFMQLLLNTVDEDHSLALTEAIQSEINGAKAKVSDAIERCNDNIIKAGEMGQTINTIESQENTLHRIININNEEIRKLKNDSRSRGADVRARKIAELNEKNDDSTESLIMLMSKKEEIAAELINYQQNGPGLESAMMVLLLKEYLKEFPGANEFLYQKKDQTWDWSGKTNAPNRYMGPQEKEDYMLEIEHSISVGDEEVASSVSSDDEEGDEEGEEEAVEEEGTDRDSRIQQISESVDQVHEEMREDEVEENEEKIKNIVEEIFSPATVDFVLRRSTRNRRQPNRLGHSGGRIPNNTLDTVNIVNPNIVTPDIIKDNPTKPVKITLIPSKVSDASGSGIKPVVKTYTNEDLNQAADVLIQMALDIRNSQIFSNLLENVEGPTLDDIKMQLIRMFTQQDNSSINEINKDKLKTPIDEEFVNGDFSISGGKTRKKKRKNKKKTKNRKNKKRKRKTRRRKNKSTKKRRKF